MNENIKWNTENPTTLMTMHLCDLGNLDYGLCVWTGKVWVQAYSEYIVDVKGWINIPTYES